MLYPVGCLGTYQCVILSRSGPNPQNTDLAYIEMHETITRCKQLQNSDQVTAVVLGDLQGLSTVLLRPKTCS